MLNTCRRSVNACMHKCNFPFELLHRVDKQAAGTSCSSIQQCYSSVSAVLQLCYSSVTAVLQQCFSSVTAVLQQRKAVHYKAAAVQLCVHIFDVLFNVCAQNTLAHELRSVVLNQFHTGRWRTPSRSATRRSDSSTTTGGNTESCTRPPPRGEARPRSRTTGGAVSPSNKRSSFARTSTTSTRLGAKSFDARLRSGCTGLAGSRSSRRTVR